MHKMRYVENKIGPPLPSPADMEAVRLVASQRPFAASLKEQLIKQERKGGASTWNWLPAPRPSKKGK